MPETESAWLVRLRKLMMKIFGLLALTFNPAHGTNTERDACLKDEANFEVDAVIRLHRGEPD